MNQYPTKSPKLNKESKQDCPTKENNCLLWLFSFLSLQIS